MKVKQLAVAGLMVVVGVVAWAGQPEKKGAAAKAGSPREQMRQINAAPDVVGKSMKEHAVLRGKDLKWGPGSPTLPRAVQMAVIHGDPKAADRVFTIRLRLPKGTRFMPHFHPADEHVTVISGDFEIGMGEKFNEKELESIPAGGFVGLPAGHPHFARAASDTEIQLHGVGPWKLIYIDPNDDPSRGVGGAGQQKGN